MTLALLILVIALQIVDVVTTVIILRRGGRELNPVLNWLMGKVGVLNALLAVKAVLIAVLLIAYSAGFPGLVYGAVFLVVLYIGIAVNNLRVIIAERAS
jgi:hypothetical protein